MLFNEVWIQILSFDTDLQYLHKNSFKTKLGFHIWIVQYFRQFYQRTSLMYVQNFIIRYYRNRIRSSVDVFSNDYNLKISFRLPNHYSISQAEIMAIKKALSWYNVMSISFTDSPAAIKYLEYVTFNSQTALNCRLSLTRWLNNSISTLFGCRGTGTFQGNAWLTSSTGRVQPCRFRRIRWIYICT